MTEVEETSRTEEDSSWPWQYNFPPFFTLQPHPETRAKQFWAWKTLILSYCKKNKIYAIDIREAHQSPLFSNTNINRKLDPTVICSILSELQKSKNAVALDKAKNRWEIYWHTKEEWSSIIYDNVCNRGLQNSVSTLYEITHGDDVQGEEFESMDEEVLIKVLRNLESQGKCELILSDDERGVKFF